jgi:RimJ/RimL family protein N-acetyltransferase
MASIRLEPIGQEHAAALQATLADEPVQRYTRVPVPVPADFASGWIGRYEEGRRQGTREMFAVFDRDGAFAGMALAADIDREAGQAELGYLVVPELRGRGLAVAILGELTRWAFEDQGLHRVELVIDVTNEGSLKVARRCGYFHEGTRRSTWLKAGFPRVDATIWSRLRTD